MTSSYPSSLSAIFKKMYLCETTRCSQKQPPDPIRGSILCDEMGLGKTLQTLALVLAKPTPGVTYAPAETETAIPMPSEARIHGKTVPVLKKVLRAAGRKTDRKKNDLVLRILDGGWSGGITGDHFPVRMRPTVAKVERCEPVNADRVSRFRDEQLAEPGRRPRERGGFEREGLSR